MTDEHDDARGAERFGAGYWQHETHYGRLGAYPEALAATMRWYRGLVRLTDRLLPRTGRHLDVGCGHGAIVHLMLRRGLDSFGFDTSEWMIEQARAAAGSLANRFAVGNAAEEPPFEGMFDLITSVEVLEHLEDPVAALETMCGRLAPGGTLLVTTPNPRNFMPFRNPALNDPTHVSVHVPGWWRDRLAGSGLTLVDDCTYVALPFVWRYADGLARWFRFDGDIGPGWLAVSRRDLEQV